MPQPNLTPANLTLPYNSTGSGRGRSRETSPASRVGRQSREDEMASEASATPPPQVNLSQEALQQLAGTVFELLKDSIGKTMQELAQHQQLQQLQQEQFLQGAAQQIEQQGQQQQQQQQNQEQQQQQFLQAAAQQIQLQGQQQQQQQTGRRNPKLPVFNVTDIDLWIGAAEVEFDNCGIADLGRRRSEMLKEISKGTHMETIRGFYTHHDEHPEHPEWGYQALINQLRTLFREKDRQRAARILRPHNLGGRMPSQFLAILSAEMSGITMDMLAKEILANVLPPNIRAIVTTDTNSAVEMATAADSFYSSSGQILERATTQTVCAATTHTVGPPSYDIMQDTDLVEGEESEEELEAPPTFPTYANICAAYRGPQRDRQRDRDRQRPQHRYPRPPAPNQQRQRPQQDRRQRSRNGNFAPQEDVCFFHRTFGDEARNCRSWCSRRGNARAGGQR